ncbi:MAG TPA: hypothetical protein VFY18_05400 [Candidatus Limnocylindrales bacterium]|nr:hypothetical protein [Candidatus Limnocylindrales bacterium]
MHNVVSASAKRIAAILLALALLLAACGGASTPSPNSNGGSTAPGAGSSAAGAGASIDVGAALSPGETNVTGSLVSSGLYAATWTWHPGNAADIGTGGVTVNSDKGTFGSISVLADGTIRFTSGAPELKSGSYTGTGAQVHMKDASGTQLPCGWTLDNDVTGTDGVLHLKGTMDVIGTVFDCPA